MYPFERFTERAKAVLTLAQHEAEAAHHSYIGTEHLLLGLLQERGCLACHVLNALGVELDAVRATIMALLSREPPVVSGAAVPTSRVKKAIGIAFEEATRMGHAYVGTEHLLLALLIEGEGVAAQVLRDLGVTLERARPEVERMLEEGVPDRPAPAPPVRLAADLLPMTHELRQLVIAASAQAAGARSSSVDIDHLLSAMISSAGMEALARLLDLRRITAMKEQAIGSQDYETAARHRTEEQKAREALRAAVTAWREELNPGTS